MYAIKGVPPKQFLLSSTRGGSDSLGAAWPARDRTADYRDCSCS